MPIAPAELEGVDVTLARALAVQALRDGKAHLHLCGCWPRLNWVLTRWHKNSRLCGTDRCIPLDWGQPLYEPAQPKGG